MPGPAVYVAVGIVAVVAVVAFKEFVYDPHLRPKVREWHEDLRERRRQRQHRRQPVPVPASTRDHGADSETTPLRSPTPSSSSSPSVEMEELISREMRAWREGPGAAVASGSGAGERPPELRQRTGAGVRAPSPGASIMDDFERGGPFPPALEPNRRDVLFDYPASPTLHPARSPTPSGASSLILDSDETFGPARSPALPPTQGISRTSTPDTASDLLSTSMLSSVDAYFTPGSDSNSSEGRSTPGGSDTLTLRTPPMVVGALSPARANAMSPFSELPSPRSEPSELGAPELESDEDLFAVRAPGSGSASDNDSDGPGSDEFDHMSDVSNWGDAAR